MAPLIDDDTPAFGEEDNVGKLTHPYVTLCHVVFRGAAILLYPFCDYVMDSFISAFVIIVLLLSIDFWVVKNITGRLMVGLRWWNYVDDNGVSHWVFESRKGRVNASEVRIFWLALVLAPAFWVLFFLGGLFAFRFRWLLLVCIALTLTGANLYGYLKCKMGHTTTVNDFFRKQVLQNMASVMSRVATTPPTNPSAPTNVV